MIPISKVPRLEEIKNKKNNEEEDENEDDDNHDINNTK